MTRRVPGVRAPVTVRDVAALAGVSVSAVSRAFTPDGSVSDDKRRRVLAAAETLGYRPNLLARSLVTRRSNIIGLVSGPMDNPFYPALTEALAAALAKAGLRPLLFTSDRGAEADPRLEEILHYKVDGIVMASTRLSSRLADECRKARVPVVMLNRTTAAPAVSTVTGDNETGARAVAAFLLAGGHRRLAFMAGRADASTSIVREEAFAAYLRERGAPPPVREVGDYAFEGAWAAAQRLFGRKDRPDAVFCANDHMAFATIEVARSVFGLAPGRDVSIVGFDDVAMAAWPGYGLTTFSQPVGPMADLALDLLDGLRQGRDAVNMVVPGRLVIRSSARLPAAI